MHGEKNSYIDVSILIIRFKTVHNEWKHQKQCYKSAMLDWWNAFQNLVKSSSAYNAVNHLSDIIGRKSIRLHAATSGVRKGLMPFFF